METVGGSDADWKYENYNWDPYQMLAQPSVAAKYEPAQPERIDATAMEPVKCGVALKKPRRRLKGAVCQVDGCGKDLSEDKSYLQRYSVCEPHFKCENTWLHNVEVRFCQQCNKFQDLREFEGTRRSCAARSKDRNMRRRMHAGKRKSDEDVQAGMSGSSEGPELPEISGDQNSPSRSLNTGSVGSDSHADIKATSHGSGSLHQGDYDKYTPSYPQLATSGMQSQPSGIQSFSSAVSLQQAPRVSLQAVRKDSPTPPVISNNTYNGIKQDSFTNNEYTPPTSSAMPAMPQRMLPNNLFTERTSYGGLPPSQQQRVIQSGLPSQEYGRQAPQDFSGRTSYGGNTNGMLVSNHSGPSQMHTDTHMPVMPDLLTTLQEQRTMGMNGMHGSMLSRTSTAGGHSMPQHHQQLPAQLRRGSSASTSMSFGVNSDIHARMPVHPGHQQDSMFDNAFQDIMPDDQYFNGPPSQSQSRMHMLPASMSMPYLNGANQRYGPLPISDEDAMMSDHHMMGTHAQQHQQRQQVPPHQAPAYSAAAAYARNPASIIAQMAAADEDAVMTRLCIKLMSCTPAELPLDMLARLKRWLNHADGELMQAFIRPGCTHVILNLSQSRKRAEGMSSCVFADGDMAAAVRHLAESLGVNFVGQRGITIQAGEAVLRVDCGQAGELMNTGADVPHITSVFPAAFVQGTSTIINVKGTGLGHSNNHFFARSQGKDVKLELAPDAPVSPDCIQLVLPAFAQAGLVVVEGTRGTLMGSWLPLVVADTVDMAAELNTWMEAADPSSIRWLLGGLGQIMDYWSAVTTLLANESSQTRSAVAPASSSVAEAMAIMRSVPAAQIAPTTAAAVPAVANTAGLPQFLTASHGPSPVVRLPGVWTAPVAEEHQAAADGHYDGQYIDNLSSIYWATAPDANEPGQQSTPISGSGDDLMISNTSRRPSMGAIDLGSDLTDTQGSVLSANLEARGSVASNSLDSSISGRSEFSDDTAHTTVRARAPLLRRNRLLHHPLLVHDCAVALERKACRLLGACATLGLPATSGMLLDFLLDKGLSFQHVMSCSAALAQQAQQVAQQEAAAGQLPSMDLLQLAVQSGNAKMVQQMLEWGETLGSLWRPDVLGASGVSALHLAAALPDQGDVSAVLLSCGPEVVDSWFTAPDAWGSTPADLAERSGQTWLTEMYEYPNAAELSPGALDQVSTSFADKQIETQREAASEQAEAVGEVVAREVQEAVAPEEVQAVAPEEVAVVVEEAAVASSEAVQVEVAAVQVAPVRFEELDLVAKLSLVMAFLAALVALLVMMVI